MKREQLYISSIASDCCAAARQYRVGIELAQYCTAARLDGAPADEWETPVDECLASAKRFVFHGPFNELTPAAIDPLVLDVTKKRYRQAIRRAQELNINKIVLHAGYQPLVYYPEWFISRSQDFWRDFVQEIPDGMTVCLENVMEPEPSFLTEIIRAAHDPQLKICLDLGHANTCVSKVPAADWLSACAPYLSHVHLHNNNGDRDLHAALFDGTLDIAALLRQLQVQAPAATCTLELMQAGPNLAWLQEQNLLE